MKMIVIKDVEFFETDHDSVITSYQSYETTRGYMEGTKCVNEIIEGDFFIDLKTNKKMCFGLSKKVKDILGMPIKAFRDMSNRIFVLEDETTRLCKKLHLLECKLKENNKFIKKILNDCVNFNHMNYFKRIWIVLTKKIIF